MNKLYTYIITMLMLFGSMATVNAEDFAEGLIRLRNKRTQNACLTTTKKGQAVGATRNVNQKSQVWVLLKNGDGYAIRSANTGEYLQPEFAQPAPSKAKLYIQTSPNNTGSQKYVNISSASDFSGKTCLNLNGDGKGIYKWSYAGDAGSDWLIETVDNFDFEEIRQELMSQNPYASELAEGKYYRITSIYGRAMTDGADITTKEIDPDNFSQYWTLLPNGDKWRIQNALSQKVINQQTTTSAPFHSVPLSYLEQFPNMVINADIKRIDDPWDYKWTISFNNDARGLHDAASQGNNVVAWNKDAEASAWAFEECEIDEAALNLARGGQAAFTDLVANKAAIQEHLNALFADKACTTLNADIAALSDANLAANEHFAALNEDMKAMVMKVKNDTWQQYTNGDYTAGYEKFFRIADYKIYSNHQDMAWATGMSYAFGKLSGPTGIVANTGDIIYIYVDSNAKTGSVLQLEAVSTDGVPGDRRTGDVTTLRQGLNLFQFTEQKMLYIFHQLTSTSAKLANFPDIKVHIEGGQLHGYWDATRGMTNADWKNMQKNLLQSCPVINLKTEHLVFAMNAALVKQYEPNEMEGLMRIWEQIPVNEDRYMGLEEFDGRLRNIWNVFSINYQYMFATTYGTYYNESTLPQIMNYNAMRQYGSLWGPSHEMGHNRQSVINVIGTTESSNNTFSNINTFEQGIGTMRCQLPVDIFNDLAKQTPWLGRDIWGTTRMFAQLYLYFHVQHHDDNFYPNLFKKMRSNPIDKGAGSGAKDYLHLAKMICDVAKADLSEFFEAYGMFEPVSNFNVEDYSTYNVTTTQSQINAAKKYMQKYVKKLGNIMFIDDHTSVTHAPDPNNAFEGKATGTTRNNNLQQLVATGSKSTAGSYEYVGDSGDYGFFTDDATPSTDDYYTLSSSKKVMTFQGTNYAGHKFYDADGNLIFATNFKKVTLPKRVTDLGLENVTIVTANYDMTDTPCTDTKPDAIRDVNTGEVVSGRTDVFDLTGRRVGDVKHSGIYIINGRKVVVK